MRATRVFKFAAASLLASVAVACGTAHDENAASPRLHVVPTSSWKAGDPSLLARASGTLNGGRVQGAFCVWLTTRRDRVPIVWPAGYHVRLHPLELLNSQNIVVARGEDHITLTGGAAPVRPGLTCMLGRRSAFYAMGNVVANHT